MSGRRSLEKSAGEERGEGRMAGREESNRVLSKSTIVQFIIEIRIFKQIDCDSQSVLSGFQERKNNQEYLYLKS